MPSNCSTHTLENIPIDVLYRIVSFISVLDIVRLRLVSKFFWEVMEGRTVWSNAYRTTTLPRHPGPFPHQSTEMLKETLLESAKLARNWAPHEPIPTARRTLPVEGDGPHQLVLGRWLMYVEKTCTRIECFDLDSADAKITPDVIYRSMGCFIRNFTSSSTVSTDGHAVAFVVFREVSHMPGLIMIKVFKVVPGHGRPITLELAGSYAANRRKSQTFQATIGPRLLVIAGDSFLPYAEEVLYIDLETFLTYTVSLTPARLSYPVYVTFIPCAAYLLVIRSPAICGIGCTSLDAFRIPPIGTAFQPDALRLSYHGEYHSKLHAVNLLHDPAVDPWLGESRILLSVGVRDVALGAYFGVARLTLSDENSPGTIICEVQHLLPQPQSPPMRHDVQFPTYSNGSVFGACVTLDHEVEAHTLTLGGSEVTHTASRILPGFFAVEDSPEVVGFDRHRGRLVCSNGFYDRGATGFCIEVFDFA